MKKLPTRESLLYNHVYTDREAAKFLRMSQIKLWRERKAGRISFRRLGGQLAYTLSDLQEYLDSNRHAAIHQPIAPNDSHSSNGGMK